MGNFSFMGFLHNGVFTQKVDFHVENKTPNYLEAFPHNQPQMEMYKNWTSIYTVSMHSYLKVTLLYIKHEIFS